MNYFCKQIGIFLVLLNFLGINQILGQGTYYNDVEGRITTQNLSCASLKTALRQLIDNHQVQSYNSTTNYLCQIDQRWNDRRTKRIIWDIYTDRPNGSEVEYVCNDFGGNANGEGQGLNREHVMPRSWFGGSGTINSDLFNLLPVDIYVNSLRSNYAFANVRTVTRQTNNGCKIGWSEHNSNVRVFEPIDAYKGDVARIFFYLATRYENQIDDWSGDGLNGTSYPAFTSWQLSVLLDWHQADPISQKEIDRNNAIYNIQRNRNPYVDHPEYVEYVWGDGSGTSCSNVSKGIIIDAKAYLQGAFENNRMNADLRKQSSFPRVSPVKTNVTNPEATMSNSTYQITGSRAIVDWIKVELRSAPQNATISKMALLRADGKIVDMNGTAPIRFPTITSGSYYVVLCHRNHLRIMTSSKVAANW